MSQRRLNETYSGQSAGLRRTWARSNVWTKRTLHPVTVWLLEVTLASIRGGGRMAFSAEGVGRRYARRRERSGAMVTLQLVVTVRVRQEEGEL